MSSVLLLAFVLATPAERVAVLEVATPGLSPEHGKALSQNILPILATEVAALGYDVISSADIDAMLSYEKQKDLLGCESDVACLAEIGGALGVDLLLSGTLGRLGDSFSLTLTLLDIRRGEVRQRFQGSVGAEAALLATAKRGVQSLFEKPGSVTVGVGGGTLFVKTNPPGASVLLNGREVGLAPLTVDEVASGEHEVVARRGDLEARRIVAIVPGKIERLELELTGKLVKVKLLSTPPEARVFIDGDYVGVTPLLRELPAGTHDLRLELERHCEHSQELTLSHEAFVAGGEAPLSVSIELDRKLQLLSIPVGLAAGLIVDAGNHSDSLVPWVELFLRAPGWLEVAMGLGKPFFVPLTLRLWLLTGGFELGVHARAVAFKRELAESGGLALSAGLSVGMAFETTMGDFGLRLEPAASRDMGFDGWTFPVAAAVVWRI